MYAKTISVVTLTLEVASRTSVLGSLLLSFEAVLVSVFLVSVGFEMGLFVFLATGFVAVGFVVLTTGLFVPQATNKLTIRKTIIFLNIYLY
ncbi:hypothetical protein FAQ01_03910 [Flavobacterium aquatile]|nr:hypothetical protein FAQ01_03910 [Flavobacterium aquatile]